MASLTIGVFCAFGKKMLPDAESLLLKAFVGSVRLCYGSDARIILISDQFLEAAAYAGFVDEVRVCDIDPQRLLLCRARAYSNILKEHDWQSPLAFLDYDILLLKNIDHVFQSAADIFLTARGYSKEMPINGGVLLLNNRDPERCRSFYDHVLCSYECLSPSVMRWWGDQLSLATAVFNESTPLSQNCIRTRSDAVVSLIPREIYNFTPYDVDSGLPVPAQLDEDTVKLLRDSVAIAHFKGPRKHLMLGFSSLLEARRDTI